MHNLHQFAVPGGLFILTLAFGFWLSREGKPYNGVLFNVHKLIALSTVVVTAFQMVKLLREVDTPALVIVLLVIAALCVIVIFVSGALMSAGKLNYVLMLTIHNVAPILLALCCALMLYMIIATRQDPSLGLAQLRARRQLTEIRAVDLKFTQGEAGVLFNRALGLPADGLSNREIETRLFLSPHTIRAHTSNIYGKLDVRSRMEAVTRAISLGLPE